MITQEPLASPQIERRAEAFNLLAQCTNIRRPVLFHRRKFSPSRSGAQPNSDEGAEIAHGWLAKGARALQIHSGAKGNRHGTHFDRLVEIRIHASGHASLLTLGRDFGGESDTNAARIVKGEVVKGSGRPSNRLRRLLTSIRLRISPARRREMVRPSPVLCAGAGAKSNG